MEIIWLSLFWGAVVAGVLLVILLIKFMFEGRGKW